MLKLLILIWLMFCAIVLNAQPIPINPTVRLGKLDNGLTYFVQHNDEPKNRAYLMIVNNVGSIVEDDHQQGFAHFLEHMNFNGTTHFPENALVEILQKSGVKYGADLNAYTGYDETVYSLPIPLNEPKMLDKGLDVLRDWACEATLDPIEIDKERDVILEEERMHRGMQVRMQKKLLPILTNESRYCNRSPIGKTDLIKSFPVEDLVRFRDEWYRPDLQAVIIVGDIDVNKTEELIIAKFSDLKNSKDVKERTQLLIPLSGKNQFAVLKDSEQSNITLQIFFKREGHPTKTEQDYREALKGILLNQMLAFKHYEMNNTIINPPYLGFSIGKQRYLANIEMMTFSVTAKVEKLEDAFNSTWGLVERIKKKGFTENDLEQAKISLLNEYEKQLREKDNIPSQRLAEQYAAFYLKGEAAPEIEWENDFVKLALPSITIQDINTLFCSYLEPKDRDMIVFAPENVDHKLPTEHDIEGWMKEVAAIDMVEFTNTKGDKPLINSLPVSGKVISTQKYNDINVTELELSNGVKVILKPTSFQADQIVFTGFSEGGLSIHDGDDYYNAVNAVDFLSGMGLGDFSSTELQVKLNGVNANISAGLAAREEYIKGISSVVDLETALQLIVLKFTNPRKDTVIFSNILQRAEEGLKARYLNPGNIFSDTISYALRNYNYRDKPFSIEQLNILDLDKMEQIYLEHFADASDFTFVFVGNFDTKGIIPLIEKYLGALPSSYRGEKARDIRFERPSGRIVKKIFAENENKATVKIFLHGEKKYSYKESLKLRALGEILQMRLLQVLREKEGGVYTPSADASFKRGESDEFFIRMSFVCSPKNVDRLIRLAELQLKEILEHGVTESEVQKFKAAYIKDLEQAQENNIFWLGYLKQQYKYDNKLNEINEYIKILKRVNSESIKSSAEYYFKSNNELIFVLLPKSTEE